MSQNKNDEKGHFVNSLDLYFYFKVQLIIKIIKAQF